MPELPFPAPPLSTERVMLRPWAESDIPAVVAACHDPLMARFLTELPNPYTEAGARAWLAEQEPARLAGGDLELAIVNGEDRLLGAIGVSLNLRAQSASVGYWLAPEARGHGYATTALTLLCGWLFSGSGPAVERIELTTDPANIASQRVAAGCGFRQEGYLHANLRFRHTGERRDSILWALVLDGVRLGAEPQPRVVWVNGTFGAGKSSAATELTRRHPEIIVFDPEYVGFILREFVTVPTGDFQDLPEWQEVVAAMAASLARHQGGQVLVPMTLWRQEYLLGIFGRLRAAGVDVVHALIDAPDEVLAARIAGDAEQPDEAHAFRQARLTDYGSARAWLRITADLVIDSGGLSVGEVADRIEPLLG